MRKPVCQYDFGARDLRSHGCMLASLAYAAREVTDGAAWKGDPEPYVFQLQKLSGVPIATFRKRGTTMTEAKAAYEQAPGFGGRVAPRLALQRGIRVREQLIPMLAEGRVAVIAVNYGVIQDGKKGVGSFRGGHGVTIGLPENGKVTVADPLRRELVQWRIDLLVEAMETFGAKPWGNGRGEAGIPLPSPTFLERAIAQRDAARRDLEKAQGRLVSLDGIVRLTTEERDQARREYAALADQALKVNAQLVKAEADLAACRADTPADCTAIEAERDGALERAAQEADRAIEAERRLDDIRAVLAR